MSISYCTVCWGKFHRIFIIKYSTGPWPILSEQGSGRNGLCKKNMSQIGSAAVRARESPVCKTAKFPKEKVIRVNSGKHGRIPEIHFWLVQNCHVAPKLLSTNPESSCCNNIKHVVRRPNMKVQGLCQDRHQAKDGYLPIKHTVCRHGQITVERAYCDLKQKGGAP